MYWLPPSAVKQSGNTMIAGPIFFSWMSRAARSGTLSPKGFQPVCPSPEPVNPTRSHSTGKRRPGPPRPCLVMPWSYCGGSHTPSLRTCASPSGLPSRIFEVCSSTNSVPAVPLGRLIAMTILPAFCAREQRLSPEMAADEFEHRLVPCDGVARLEYPVVLVRKHEQLAVHAVILQRFEQIEPFVDRAAVIAL